MWEAECMETLQIMLKNVIIFVLLAVPGYLLVKKNLLKEKWFSYTIALCSAVALYMILTHLSGILHFLQSIWRVGSPVFMAFVIAYVLGPLAEVYSKYVLYKIEQGKLRHTLSVILAVLSVVLFIVILAVAQETFCCALGKKVSFVITYLVKISIQ